MIRCMNTYTYIHIYVSFSEVKTKSPPPNNYRANFENPYPGPHSRRVCCETQVTCPLCEAADMSAV